MKSKSKMFIQFAVLFISLLSLQQNIEANIGWNYLDHLEGWYLPAGININEQERDVYYGAEVSIVNISTLFPLLWIGWYGDYSTDSEKHQFSTGPEFGWFFFGADIGYLGVTNNNYKDGVSFRFLLNIPIILGINRIFPLLSPYIRYCLLFQDKNNLEFGILIKIAIKLD